MNIKNALTRAIRTALQVLASGILGLPVVQAVGDIKTLGAAYTVVLYTAGASFVVSLAQNLAEDSSSLNIPKG